MDLSGKLRDKLTRPVLTVILHASVWVLMIGMGTAFFSRIWAWEIALFRSVVNGALFGVLFYGNILWLFPRYIPSRRYGRYLLYSILLLVTLFFARILLKDYVYGPAVSQPAIQPVFAGYFILATLLFVWFVSLVYGFAMLQDRERRHRELLTRQRTEAELALLKSQVNPHFLFNTLNNLYSLSFRGDARTPDCILALSQMMHYMIHEAARDRVPLASEIRYLQEFILLQKLRIDGEHEISATFPDPVPELQVAPLIFLPLVENAFKHSGLSVMGSGFIRIRLDSAAGEIRFTAANSLSGQGGAAAAVSGTGLENLRQRLLHLYPERHSLMIRPAENEFLAELKIAAS
jgi:LytS/YehU family sensor histidine kinase